MKTAVSAVHWPTNPAFATAPLHPKFKRGEPLHPVQIAGLKRMSVAQKLDMMVAIYQAAIDFSIAGLRMRHPNWTEAQLDLEARRRLLHART